MERDDIIRMAREAGMEVHEQKKQIRIGSAVIAGNDSTFEVVRFAALVAAHEREECAKVLDKVIVHLYIYNYDGDASTELRKCAKAIRARGEK